MADTLAAAAALATALTVLLGFAYKFVIRPVRELAELLEQLKSLPEMQADLSATMSKWVADIEQRLGAIETLLGDELNGRRRHPRPRNEKRTS